MTGLGEAGALWATAAEAAARQAAEAAAARLAALVAGLGAIVWEADARTWEFTFVSGRAEELLGYPADEWLEDADFWPRIIHPDDRDEALRFCAQGTADGHDYDFSYRAVAADGRVVWLHDVVHVVRDTDGSPCALQGVMIDITEQKRREQSAALLAEAGRLLAGSGSVADRLAAAAGLALGQLGDLATVWLRGDDGRYRPVAAAPAAVAPHVLGLAPLTNPEELEAAYRVGRPFVLPDIGDDLVRAVTADDAQFESAIALGSRSALVVPLVANGRPVGSLTLIATGPDRRYDDAALALAGDLGDRMAAMMAAERVADRQRALQRITAALAAADGLTEAAEALTAGVGKVFGASGLAVYAVDLERGGLRQVHATGYPDDVIDRYAAIRLDDPVPTAEAARTGEPVWLRDRAAVSDYPGLPGTEATGSQAAAALPLHVRGRVLGVLVASFPTPREFPPDEREFAVFLAGQAAQAIERATDADQRRGIAETLQHSLLPAALPDLPRLSLAARYLPGAAGVEAGGDWYDVLDLDTDHVALVVGDVVGQGARAAAVMGQLRSALASSLLQGQAPAAALEHLDRFAARVPGAAASTVAVLILDTATGELRWASAGHPPPLVVDPAGGHRFLLAGHGPCLRVTGRPPFTEGRTRIVPGTCAVLYSDGLVERSGEVIDDGLDELASVTADLRAAPGLVADRILDHMLAGRARPDDVALVVARLLPPPLRLSVAAVPAELSGVRRRVRVWGGLVGLPDDLTDDLIQCVDEATANCADHAYPDSPGDMEVELTAVSGGAISARVTDFGRWRPPPTDRGHRGRGLELIKKLSEQSEIEPGPAGTTVRFRFTAPADPTRSPGISLRPGPRPIDRPAHLPAPATLQAIVRGGSTRLRVHGDLDLAGAATVRRQVLDRLASDTVVVLELPAGCYLSSNGIALLTEAHGVARAAGGRLRLVMSSPSMAHRALTVAGLADLIDTAVENR